MSTILVVEDEMNIRKFIVVNLKVRGYNVWQASSAENGLQLLRDTHIFHDQPPDALLLDIKLPGMSGWDMLKTIADDPMLRHIPTIIISATPSNNQREDSSYDQIVAHLTKPISAGELVRTVGQIFHTQG